MSKDNKSQIVTIDNVDYDANDFTPEQAQLVSHCFDLDRKIGSTQFQLQQLEVGKQAFMTMLKQALEAKPDEPADPVE